MLGDNGDGHGTHMIGAKVRQYFSAVGAAEFWGITTLLVFSFLLGGSSRTDVVSLLFLQPVAFAVLFLAWHRHGSLSAMGLNAVTMVACGLVLVPAIQLVPLLPEIWTHLPGRENIAAIDASVGLGPLWRPLSLTPTQTLIALLSLAVPLSVLLLSLRLDRYLLRTPWIVAAIGLACFVIALLQSLGSDPDYLRPYLVTNSGEIVGLFANRNHQAVFFACLMLTIAFLGGTTSTRYPFVSWVALASWLLVFMMIVVSASRAGLLLGLLAASLSWPIHAASAPRISPRRPGKPNWMLLAGGAVVALLLLAVTLDRSQSFSRLVGGAVLADTRWDYMASNLDLVRIYWATGAGIGSYELVARMYEPDALLSGSYMNQAHNDWLQVIIEGGILALLALALVVWLLLPAIMRSFSPSAQKGPELALKRLGGSTLLLIAIASIADYPLRTPAFAAFCALATAWVLAGNESASNNQLPENG